MIDDIEISRGHRGNSKLKRVGEEIEWTPERIQEFAKCQMDPIYFCRTYMKIVHVDDGTVPFNLYDYQERMIRSMNDNRNTIITTARQIGKSTVTCGFILWYILFHADKTVALLANKGDTAREIMGKITFAYSLLPKWLQHGVVEMNKGSMVLENNSRVIATATSGSAIRGYSINLLFIDEAAFIENWEEFFTAVAPTISSGKSTKIILVSTPNGLNHYYALWNNAIQKKSDYVPIKVTWREVPGRDEAWRQKTLADLNFDQDKFNQENEAEFLGSSGTLISGAALKALSGQIPIYDHDSLKQYEAPDKTKQYVMVCDVSKGAGLDHSAFSVFDVTAMPYKQVATYYSNLVLPQDYAEVIHNTARTYNNATVLVEINNIGESVANMLYSDLEYEGLLFTESAGSRGKQISTKAPTKAGIDKGINTTKTVKAKGCSILKALVENQQLIINDYTTIAEISRFSKKGTSYEAESGSHDDLVMGLVLFAWLTDQQFFKDLTDINTLQILRNRTSEDIENDMMPFGFVVDGRDEDGTGAAVIVGDFEKALLCDVSNDAEMEKIFNQLFG